jgi:hypothetical protein
MYTGNAITRKVQIKTRYNCIGIYGGITPLRIHIVFLLRSILVYSVLCFYCLRTTFTDCVYILERCA